MKEFIEKLINRLEEYRYNTGESIINLGERKAIYKISNIIDELAEEYSNDFCEWKVDGVYLMCQHKTELFVSCLEDEKYRYKHCPICGKKIKVVE